MKSNVESRIEPASKSGRLVERIRDRIVSGELAPGSKVTEEYLAAEFGSGRAPLREALCRLEERRLIERSPFSRMRIASISPRMIADLYEVREVLEGLACRRAAGIITAEQTSKLRANLRERASVVERTIGHDTRQQPTIQYFHTDIARISDNHELSRLLNCEIWHVIRAFYSRWSRSDQRRLKGLAEHERIIDALEARDPDVAELLMKRHVAAAGRDLSAICQKIAGDDAEVSQTHGGS